MGRTFPRFLWVGRWVHVAGRLELGLDATLEKMGSCLKAFLNVSHVFVTSGPRQTPLCDPLQSPTAIKQRVGSIWASHCLLHIPRRHFGRPQRINGAVS